ncbi:autotransporter domain-containing protein [Vibrio harveyi]|uniref:autotransporter domain-containing protein n=1 Tax=Vibrio harveyi TaxID=669 RepID=UPI0018F19D20|nr:autotransporter domain-containing protein [Vibrio harveyi]
MKKVILATLLAAASTGAMAVDWDGGLTLGGSATTLHTDDGFSDPILKADLGYDTRYFHVEGGLGTNFADEDGYVFTFSGAAGYTFDLNENWKMKPYLGLSKTEVVGKSSDSHSTTYTDLGLRTYYKSWYGDVVYHSPQEGKWDFPTLGFKVGYKF